MNTIERSLDRKRFINRCRNPRFAQEMERAFNEKRIVPFSVLYSETETDPILDGEKINKDIIQLSFIVTDANKSVLAMGRSELSLEAKRGHTISDGHSILVGWSPVENPYGRAYLMSEADVLWAYRKEVNDDHLSPPRLHFLGLVKNIRKGIRYYFYVFNVEYTEVRPRLPSLRKDRDDKILGFSEVNAELVRAISKNKADLRALQLLPGASLEGCDFGESEAVAYNPQFSPPFLSRKPDVFISHSSADHGVVKELEEALDRAQLVPWVDHQTLKSGDEWIREIESGIKYSGCFVLLCSSHSEVSKVIPLEVAWACARRERQHNFQIIPVALEGVSKDSFVPEVLQRFQIEDCRAVDQRQEKFRRLAGLIRAVLTPEIPERNSEEKSGL